MDRSRHNQRSKSALQVYQYLVRRFFWRTRVAWSAWIAPSASIDRTHPSGLDIADDVWIGPYAMILTHDMTRGVYLATRIGARSVIGSRAVILPGVTIGWIALSSPDRWSHVTWPTASRSQAIRPGSGPGRKSPQQLCRSSSPEDRAHLVGNLLDAERLGDEVHIRDVDVAAQLLFGVA